MNFPLRVVHSERTEKNVSIIYFIQQECNPRTPRGGGGVGGRRSHSENRPVTFAWACVGLNGPGGCGPRDPGGTPRGFAPSRTHVILSLSRGQSDWSGKIDTQIKINLHKRYLVIAL